MNRKIIIFIISFFIFIFIFIGTNIGKKDGFLESYKRLIPDSLKKTLKEKIFVYKYQKELNSLIEFQAKLVTDLKEKVITVSFNEIEFTEDKSREMILNNSQKLKVFSAKLKNALGPRGYLQFYGEHLFYITGTGKIYSAKIKEINNKKITFKSIDSDFYKVAGSEYIKESKNIVNHFLIKDDKIYISYNKKKSENCFFNSLSIAKLNFQKLVFDEQIDFDECAFAFSYSAAGRLENFKDKKILMTIGDHDPYSAKEDQPQKMNNLYGKTIEINTLNKDVKIMSIGHRNSQGLFYDKKDRVIFSTDHGPEGGDELNILKDTNNGVKNFGWPISSYGKHYKKHPLADAFTDPSKSDNKYIKQPLKQSHAKFGFVEPIFYWKKSSPPTQVLRTNPQNLNDEKIIYVSTLGQSNHKNHKSLHKFKFSENYKLKDYKILPIGERIRDMIYLNEQNIILLYLEATGSIGVLSLDN